MKKVLLIALIGLTLVLAACSDDENTENGAEQGTNETEQGTETEQETNEETQQDTAGEQESANIDEIISSAQVENDVVVANVNGQEVLGNKYNMLLGQTVPMMQQYGQDPSDQEVVKEQTLNAVISQEVLSQELDNKGIEVSSSEVDEQIELLRGNFESDEKFQEYIGQLSLSEDQLEEQMAYELKIQQYMETEIEDVEITDEQVEQYYEMLSSQSEDVPELAEIKPTIKEQLKSQQKDSQLSQRIQQLQEEAEIETLI